MGLFVHYLQNWKKWFIIIISQTFVEIKNLIHEELQVFNSIKTHHHYLINLALQSSAGLPKDLNFLLELVIIKQRL
jgi:hypothetical protein